MKKDETEKKATVGCFVVAALFFLMLGIYLHYEERSSKQEMKPSTAAPLKNTAPSHQKTKTATSIFTPEEDEETDGDLYENPDFDDLFPGEEYDEEFVDRSKGDPELYDEP